MREGRDAAGGDDRNGVVVLVQEALQGDPEEAGQGEPGRAGGQHVVPLPEGDRGLVDPEGFSHFFLGPAPRQTDRLDAVPQRGDG